MPPSHPERLSAAINVKTFNERRPRRDTRPNSRLVSPTSPLYGRHLREYLAEHLGKPEHAVYRMLDQGLIPGVQKQDPTRPKSHWFAPDPGACIRRYFAGERGARRAA